MHSMRQMEWKLLETWGITVVLNTRLISGNGIFNFIKGTERRGFIGRGLQRAAVVCSADQQFPWVYKDDLPSNIY